MKNLLIFSFGLLASFFRSRAALQLENIALRHQLNVLRRSTPKRPRLNQLDRIIFAALYRLWPKIVGAISIVRPETVIGWHRQGFRLYWRWKCGGNGGRPKVPEELRDLIRDMSLANPLWGAPRIHGELLKLGIEVSEATVARYMIELPRPPGPDWKTFLQTHLHETVSTDFFVVPTVAFKLLYGMVVLHHVRRQILHVAVTQHPTAEWTAQQLTEAFPWQSAARFCILDGHGSFRGKFQERSQKLGITSLRTAPASPWQNAFVERLIGSIRRECLDHVIILNERHLRRILKSYVRYYNHSRTHLSLGKDTPLPQPANRSLTGKIIAFPEVGGLHHRYERLAA